MQRACHMRPRVGLPAVLCKPQWHTHVIPVLNGQKPFPRRWLVLPILRAAHTITLSYASLFAGARLPHTWTDEQFRKQPCTLRARRRGAPACQTATLANNESKLERRQTNIREDGCFAIQPMVE